MQDPDSAPNPPRAAPAKKHSAPSSQAALATPSHAAPPTRQSSPNAPANAPPAAGTISPHFASSAPSSHWQRSSTLQSGPKLDYETPSQSTAPSHRPPADLPLPC